MIQFSLLIDEILKEVDMQTYYAGESKKRQDVDADITQTSSDNYDELSVFMDTALNDVSGMLLKRTRSSSFTQDEKSILCSIDPFTVKANAEYISNLLKKAIFDYVVNYIVYKWIEMVKPEMAGLYFQNIAKLEYSVIKYVGMLSGHPRRRATDLAGI